MTQGYIIIGTDDYNQTKNITCAYALSLSLKLADPKREVCVVVNKFSDVPKKYEEAFDYIIELPFGRTDSNHEDIFIDFWQLYYCTPFEETMFINTFSYAISNIDSLWDISAFGDVGLLTSFDFQGNKSELWLIQDTEKTEFLKLSGDVVYFKKGEKAAEFFKMADPAFKNWRQLYQIFADNIKYKNFELTAMVNVVLTLIGESFDLRDEFSYTNLLSRFGDYQRTDNREWINQLNIWIDQDLLTFKINNYSLTGIVTYHDARIVDKFDLRKLYDNHRKKNTKIKK